MQIYINVVKYIYVILQYIHVDTPFHSSFDYYEI
jgi:hypothetical protein